MDAAKWLLLAAAGEPEAEGDTTPERAATSSTRARTRNAKEEEQSRSMMAATSDHQRQVSRSSQEVKSAR